MSTSPNLRPYAARAMSTSLLFVIGVSAAAEPSIDPLFSNQFESGAIVLAPELIYARAGTTGFGIGGPLQLSLDEPAVGDVFVPITTSNPSALSVIGGGVTVLDGETDAIVSMNALASDPTPVLLRASLGNQVYASVRVVNDAEPRNVASIRPNPANIAPLGSRNFIARLDLPAPLGGSMVDLAVAPLAAGTFTPGTTITVAADTFSKNFTYTDAMALEIATVSASVAGGPAAQATVIAAPIGKLVINEVDYDQTGPDGAEFIEIYNRSPDEISMSGLAVVLVNGSDNAEYARFDLSQAAASLAPDEYLLLGNSSIVAPENVPFIDIGVDPVVHNGPPDGVALIDSDALALLDGLSYEGSITAALIDGFAGPVNLVEGTELAAVDDESGPRSLARVPNGTDVNNANTDFIATPTLTPGLSNDTVPPAGRLVINEVDYDQPSTDSTEFIEIYNGTGAPVALSGLHLVFINGSSTPSPQYLSVDLSASGTLAAGQYLVVHRETVTIAVGAISVLFANPNDNIQNGAPDGVALFDSSTDQIIDALSYEGSINNASFTGFPGVRDLVEGSPFTGADTADVVQSLARLPDGTDTDNAADDWNQTPNLTPGAPNQ